MTVNPKNVLVVDDSSSLRSLVRMALEKAGYNVFEASDGRCAIGMLPTAMPDLIVCDMNMPHVDGLAFVQYLKTTVLHRFTPLVMLTTSTNVTQKAAAREAGVSAWIQKPFESRALVGAVDRLCH